ncbi:HAMP domain-containing histidine kinase [Spirosoma taeanense]|uniref:histidine kinase n=1 Tax=Spirosoma taeanense TaxID=2735870 RepID=A0A6M5Y760_9BACT|nr:HAMP domain-containing sensor histidine kinase [Spirosoma taeanense]QJW89256.1 HAMP domain-containing histidine kinase [Spirosoma taeanense]
MNRRIRSIFWLMTLCIIGINAFQGYWLWTTYHLKSQQYNQMMRDALFSVLQQHQVAEANRLFARQGNKEPMRMRIHPFIDRASQQQVRVIRRPSRPPLSARGTHPPDLHTVTLVKVEQPLPPGTEVPVFESPDTLAHRISTLLLLDWTEGTRINLARLSDAYRAELIQRDINPAFTLDTVSVPQKTSSATRVHQVDTRPEQRGTPNVLNKIVMPVNPVRNLFAQVTFETPTFYLLRRMGWLLGGSVFILLLTTGSFLFMLSTILRQKKLSEVKNDFINNMTHELKTPIATVTAAVEALQHFGALDDPAKTQTYLAISQNNLQRLSDLVEKVLNLAVEEKRELALRPEPINPRAMVSELIANHQLKAPKSITFQVDMPADTLVTVDRVHFANALNNLIDNAIKYSGESVSIRIAGRQEGPIWWLSVKDNGIGIPKAYQGAIFDRFFRVPTGNLHPVKGFGLGLSYVRQVVERHGGLVEVTSEPGQGSEFTVLVPLAGSAGQAGIKRFRITRNPLHFAS